MAEQPAARRFLWEDFELDLRLRRLLRSGRRVRLQPIPLQILELLLERPGEVVTRDDLQHSIWNGYSYGDFDHSLNIAISKLRTGLDDSPKEPRFIETLPQVGYRFMVPVETARAVESNAEIAAQSPAKRALWLRRAGVLGFALLVLGLATYWAGRRLSRPAETTDS